MGPTSATGRQHYFTNSELKISLRVHLKALFGYSREVERFLKIELQGRVKRKGARLLVEMDKLRVLKLKLEKFLYHHRLDEYRNSEG